MLKKLLKIKKLKKQKHLIKVYNGYKEKYIDGKKLKKFLSNVYELRGEDHEVVNKTKINLKYYPRLKDNEVYRIFYNNKFIKIMNAEKDYEMYFIGYTKSKEKFEKEMEAKNGRRKITNRILYKRRN